jgi:hypothetical protein
MTAMSAPCRPGMRPEMPALPRRPGSAGARPLSRPFLPGQGLRSGGIWQPSASTDRQDQPSQSVHAFRGTPATTTLSAGSPTGSSASSTAVSKPAPLRREHRLEPPPPAGCLTSQAPGMSSPIRMAPSRALSPSSRSARLGCEPRSSSTTIGNPGSVASSRGPEPAKASPEASVTKLAPAVSGCAYLLITTEPPVRSPRPQHRGPGAAARVRRFAQPAADQSRRRGHYRRRRRAGRFHPRIQSEPGFRDQAWLEPDLARYLHLVRSIRWSAGGRSQRPVPFGIWHNEPAMDNTTGPPTSDAF